MIEETYNNFQKYCTVQSLVTNTVDVFVTNVAAETLCESSFCKYTLLGLGSLSIPICALCAFQSFCFSVSLLFAPSLLSLIGAAYWGASTIQVIFTLPECLASLWILGGLFTGQDRSTLFPLLRGYMSITAKLRDNTSFTELTEQGVALLFQNLACYGNALDCIYLAYTSVENQGGELFLNLEDTVIESCISFLSKVKTEIKENLIFETKQLHGEWNEGFSWLKSLHYVATDQADSLENSISILQ